MTKAATLKLVSVWSSDRSVRDRLGEVLSARVPVEDVRFLYGRNFLVYTPAEPEEIRGWVAPQLHDGESVFVAEVTRWAADGPAPDYPWLAAR